MNGEVYNTESVIYDEYTIPQQCIHILKWHKDTSLATVKNGLHIDSIVIPLCDNTMT